ncbi:Aminodeoxychorismate synthase component 2 [Candidatus Arsenophonus lipoptenae]|uniref:Aminodeoxychorismate synthase component 2 n=1 Tax=Candidatus Arsenophonus lipoptenae TaxID=634113 RepID=A0A109Q8Q9_9GAMM|nr:aminodeoxychorismate/anthranilate synthase component II [Candidatus Arsenophonus lipoptenae]AMA64860.1 Aminodeoxychorismate synthase component 2 [Candidatus Arsenophonus lipoptenae]
MFLMIDNYDSFTYNIYQYLCELGADVIIKRNDAISIIEIKKLSPSHLIISPGPGTPNQAGISLSVISYFAGKIPILGICLGHQIIAQAFGASIIRAKKIMHGKVSTVYHNKQGIFQKINHPLNVTRYHSLIVEEKTLPKIFEITAWTSNNGNIDEIMGIKHKTLAIEGVQFHPESILSEQGHKLLNTFIMY